MGDVIREATPTCHSARPQRCRAAQRSSAKPALSDAEGESGVGQTVARRLGALA